MISRLLLCMGLSLIVIPVLSQPLPVDSVGQNLTPSQELEAGKNLYQQGQYLQALTAWQMALSFYQTRENLAAQVQTLNYISLAHQHLQRWTEAEEAINTSLAILKASSLPNSTLLYAQTLNNRGQLEFNLGQVETALNTWKIATANYEKAGDQIGISGSLINQAQALEALGFYGQTCKTLSQALKINFDCNISANNEIQIVLQVFQQQEPQIALLGLRSLGNNLRVIGHLESAQKILQSSLQVPQSSQQKSITLISLGQVNRAEYRQYKSLYNRSETKATKETVFNQGSLKAQQALSYYQQAIQEAATIPEAKLIQIQAQLHNLSLLIELQKWFLEVTPQSEEIKKLNNEINEQINEIITTGINDLTPSQTAIYAQLNFADSLIQLSPQAKFIPLAIQAAENSLKMAQFLADEGLQSYALGTLGYVYEQTQNWAKAQSFTEQALILSQVTQNSDLTYKWQWQLGRIYGYLGKREAAITSYQAAVNTLDTVRQDLLILSSEVQYSFREQVEPLYRQYIDLLLNNSTINF